MIGSNDLGIWVKEKCTILYKTEQYHREAECAKILRNIVVFRLNVRIHVSNRC